MNLLMIGIGGLVAAVGIAALAWLRLAAPNGSRRTARRVAAELRELGLVATSLTAGTPTAACATPPEARRIRGGKRG
jgi:hypothetical protein